MSLKLRLSHLDGNDRRKTLAEVLTGNLYLGFLDLLGDLRIVVGIVLERTCQSHAETGDVRTTLDGVDIVDVRVKILRIIGVIHDGHLDGHTLLLGLQVDDVVEEMRAVTVDVAHKFLQAVLGVEHLCAGLTLNVGAHVVQRDANTGVQISQLAHTTGHHIPLECCCGENGGIGPELLACTTLGGLTNHLHRVKGASLLVFLLVDVAIAEHLREHVV